MIIEDQLSISTKHLKELKLLKNEGKRTTTLTFHRENLVTGNKEKIASLQITVNIEPDNDYIVLDYVFNGKEICDIIKLQAIRGNLGDGCIYFFLCPKTGKKCRKIYLHEGHFISRYGIGNMLYYQQAIPKVNRNAFRLGRDHRKIMQMRLERLKPYFKETYEGIRTKKVRKIEWADVKLSQLRRQMLKI